MRAQKEPRGDTISGRQERLKAGPNGPQNRGFPDTAGGGNDFVRGGALPNTLDGGSGDDTVIGGNQKDVLHGDKGLIRINAGVDSLGGGRGDDQLFARDGVADSGISCGDGSDSADVDLLDQQPINGRGRITFCENITAGAVEEGPNVRIRGRSLRVSRRGRVTVRLACPQGLSQGCAGELTLAGVRGRRSAELASRRYGRIAAGRNGAIRLRLTGSDLRRARRYKQVRVTSVEEGELGDKTTVATLGLTLPR
jgi:RTX calcium-binding nonapeptide repeat (4 copies)